MKDKTVIETKEFNILTPFVVKADEANPEVIKIEGFANYMGMPDKDGYGTYSDLVNETVQVDGIDLKDYKNNPIVLLQHDRDEPIGKCTKLEKRKDGLWVTCEIYKDACDEQTWARIKNGIIKSFSIGFRVIKTEVREDNLGNYTRFIMKSKLFEISCVSIPCCSPSNYGVVKCLEDGSFFTEPDEIKNHNQKETSNIGEEKMIIKLKDTLSTEDVEKYKALGLDSKLEEELEVDVAKYLEYTLFKTDSPMGLKMQATVERVCVGVVGRLLEDAAKAKSEAEEAATQAIKLTELAAELGVTVEEAKELTEEQVIEKRKAISDTKNDEIETVDKFKSLIETLEKTQNEITKE